MAQSATQVTGTGAGSNPYRVAFDLIATADGDNTTTTITHGLTMTNLVPAAGGNDATPTTIPQALKVTIVPLTAAGVLSGWAWTNSSNASTTVIVTKTATTAGSGAAPAQARVYIERAAVNGY